MFTPIGFFAPSGPEVITDSLEQWMDVTTAGGSESSALTDASGNGRNLTNNGFTWDATNNWFYLSSNTDWTKHIGTNYHLSNYGGSYSYTVEMWVKVAALSDAGQMIYGDRTGTFGNNFFVNSYRDDQDFGSGIADTQGDEAGAVTNTVYDDVWVLATFANDGTTQTAEMRSNGSTEATVDMSAIGNVNSGRDWALAGKYVNSFRYFEDVQIGSWRKYSKYLTEAETLQNYNAEKAHFGL
jgi:hypothetical protein